MSGSELLKRLEALGCAMSKVLESQGEGLSPNFPRLAAEQLTLALPELQNFSLEEIVSAGLATSAEQLDVKSRFGDPPITWFMGEGFCVESYVWNDNTTSVHDHSFAGAWTTLLGQSLHRHYRFEAEEKISSGFELGRLFPTGFEQLRPGMVRQILPGDEFIHDLYHLDRPSITLIIRSCRLDRPERGQRHYVGHEKRAIALETFDRPEREVLGRRLLNAVLEDSEDTFWTLFRILVGQHDFEQVTRLVTELSHRLSHTRLGDCLRQLERRWPDKGPYVSEAVLHHRHLCTMINLRRHREAAQDRLLLGLLRCPSGRSELLKRVSDLTGTGDPSAWVLERLEQWSEDGQFLSLNPAQRRALHGILEDRPADGEEALERFTLHNETILRVLGTP